MDVAVGHFQQDFLPGRLVRAAAEGLSIIENGRLPGLRLTPQKTKVAVGAVIGGVDLGDLESMDFHSVIGSQVEVEGLQAAVRDHVLRARRQHFQVGPLGRVVMPHDVQGFRQHRQCPQSQLGIFSETAEFLRGVLHVCALDHIEPKRQQLHRLAK